MNRPAPRPARGAGGSGIAASLRLSRPDPAAARRHAPAPTPRGGHEAQIALGDLLDRVGRAGHGVALLALALPAFLPLPLTGTPAGIGIVIAATRIALGHGHPWLPGFLRRIRVRRSLVLAGMRRLAAASRLYGQAPWRRVRFAGTGAGRWLLALSTLAAGAVILAPIPFGNQLPALAVAAFGLGLARRDGFAVLAGHALTALALAWAAGLLLAGHRLGSWAVGLLWN